MNIYKIAQLAGVSKSTVSRVLSNNGSVSQASYDKVMQVVKEYNYKPNQYARILNNMPTKLIGVITPDITNAYFSEIINQITEIASNASYNVILCNIDNASQSEISYLSMLEDMQADGAILLCPRDELSIQSHKNMPIVSIDAIIDDTTPYICSDFYKGGFIAAQKLIENGCKHILHLTGHTTYYANIQRIKGFNAAIEMYKTPDTVVSSLTNLSNKLSYSKIKYFLTHNNSVDGIFTGNDNFAFTVIRILNELNISIPDDIQLIGYDDNFMVPMVYPLLSTIHQPISEIGSIAATTLLNLINNQQVRRENILDIKYIKRSTTLL